MTSRLRMVGTVVLLVASPLVVGGPTGFWWAPFVLGLAAGLLTPRARIAIPLGAAIGLLGWGVPLLINQFRYGLGPAAGSISAILGFGHKGVFAIALTLLVGLLLGLTGAWLGSAARPFAALVSLPAPGTAPRSPRKG